MKHQPVLTKCFDSSTPQDVRSKLWLTNPKYIKNVLLLIVLAILMLPAYASEPGITAFTIAQDGAGGATYSLSLRIVALMTVMMVLPALLMTMTCFTRIIIVLAILRQAIGMPNVPSNQILIGLTLFITLFIMMPVLQKANEDALQPYLRKEISEQIALQKAAEPFKSFMLHQTRKDDLTLFIKLAGQQSLTNYKDVPFLILMPAFLTSELKTAFQIGFLLFLPFLIIDLVVASVLMSMGMMMLAPPIVSLPFKIMLFVLVNGWVLIVGTLASSFTH